jgi:hypothetical protein
LANFVKPTGSQKYQLNDPKQKEATDSHKFTCQKKGID